MTSVEPFKTRRNPRKNANPKSLSQGIDDIGSVSVIPVFPERKDSDSESDSTTQNTKSSHPLLTGNGDIQSVMAAMLGEPPLNARSPPLDEQEPLEIKPIEIKPESDSDSEDCFIEESKSKVAKQAQQTSTTTVTSAPTSVPNAMPLTMPISGIPVPGGMLIPVPGMPNGMPILVQALPNNMALANGATVSTSKLTPIQSKPSAAMCGIEYRKDRIRVCEWMNYANGTMCGQSFNTMDGIVDHINTVHANHENADLGHVCCWRNCERHNVPFKARYKLINHLR